jgi:PAS domain S-box-containing protein
MVEHLPKEWSDKVNKIESANQQHLTNKAGRNEFTGFYITTLTISLGFAICLSIILAFWLGNQITQPLLLIEQNTKLVASGDLRPKQEIETNDELGMIMKGFNHMTKQLSESRLMEHRSKNRLEGILTTMTAGVILLDQNQRLLRYNKSAEELLSVSLFEYLQNELVHKYHQNLNDLLKTAYYYFRQQKKWQTEYEYIRPDGSVSYLLMKGSILKSLDEKNLLIVFDDLTEILSAQRTNAWGEVAKRLAHEIKNPLTPIQLSAERLQIKLQNKLGDAEQAILDKSTNTIINQVSALKRLVDEFRHYSRLPQAILSQINLNDLIQDVVQLYKSSNNIYWKLELNDVPEVLIDVGQVRQVLHNLIQNSQDAMMGFEKQAITITTSLSKKGVHLCVADTGPGFDKAIIDKVFEPYITTKKTGTGLGMAIVKKVIQENNADITINNRIDNNNNGCIMGAEVHIWFKSV